MSNVSTIFGAKSPLSKPDVNVPGVLKVKIVGPSLQIVTPYTVNNEKPVASIRPAPENDSSSEDAKRKRVSTSSGAESPLSKPDVNVPGVLKVEQVGPIFRIVTPYTVNNQKAVASKRPAPEDDPNSEDAKRKRGDLYANDTGPVWHKFSSPMITPSIISKNLPLQFKDLPIFGAPNCSAKLKEYEKKKIREFVGFDLDDAEYEELENYCNPDNLKTGKELKMSTKYPNQGLLPKNFGKDLYSDDDLSDEDEKLAENNLFILKRLRNRQARDVDHSYPKCLKYRGVKQIPLRDQEKINPKMKFEPPELQPGMDILYRIRVYRPFTFQLTGDKHVRGRHSVFCCDLVMLGRQRLTEMRDRMSCRNDLDMRLDKSEHPDDEIDISAKRVFPSGFMFINNVFYVDNRDDCHDLSAGVRSWAFARGLGDFPVKDMHACTLDQVLIKLAHPEVYMHQGSCEHVFLFSEVRLLGRSDPLHLAAYPTHTVLSQNQAVYCNTCMQHTARWLVTHCSGFPFDPAYCCETCFQQFLYKDGKKIGTFKAYAYRGNEISLKSNEIIMSYI